jgi:hypothetical protein
LCIGYIRSTSNSSSYIVIIDPKKWNIKASIIPSKKKNLDDEDLFKEKSYIFAGISPVRIKARKNKNIPF